MLQSKNNTETQTTAVRHVDGREYEVQNILKQVFAALQEKGYNPVNQLVGYIMSGDPTYITNHNNARSLICRIERDELMNILVRAYIEELNN